MTTISKWTTEEDSILVEAVLAGTLYLVFIPEAYSAHGYQLDRGFVGIQSPNVFQEGATNLAASGGFIR
jgi:hypothetical protein